MSRRLVVLAPVGGLAFTLTWVVLGAVSPGYELFGTRIAPYSWISQPVSGLGLGVTAVWMNGAFIICGVLLTTGVLSTASSWWSRGGSGRWAVVLLSLMGVGMIVCGVFTLESMMLHLVGFLLAVPLPAIGLILAGVSLRHDAPRLASLGSVCGALALILLVVFMSTFDSTGAGSNQGISGLIQRVLIVVITLGVVILALASPRPDRRVHGLASSASTGVVASR